MRQVKFKPATKPVLNLGKGWVLYGSPESQPAECLALAGLGYRRFEWSDIEPAPGKFIWTPIDEWIRCWAAVGRQSAFGVMCLNSHTGRTDGCTTPQWVFDAGAACRVVELGAHNLPHEMGGLPGRKVVPDFADPVFLDKLEAFIHAMANRYDGNRDLAFVDVRSYGNWGEGHMWPFAGEGLSSDEYRRHLDFHLAAFKTTRLCLSCENAGPHTALYDWAVQKQGMAARRDGICGNSNGHEVLRAFGHAPGVFELYGPYRFLKERGWWDGVNDGIHGYRLEDCLEVGKPSYCDLSRSGDAALELLRAEPELVHRLADRMGYHFVPVSATIEECGDGLAIELKIRNDGVAPLYEPCHLVLAYLDDELRDCGRFPVNASPRDWTPGDNVTISCRGPRANGTPAVGLFSDPAATRPDIRFGVDAKAANGWLVLD